MSITARFTSGSPANGLQCVAFGRDQAGVGLFFHPVDQATVANDEAVFSSISVSPFEYAFTVSSTVGTIWRSGPHLVQSSAATDHYLIMKIAPVTFTSTALASMLPPLPITSGGGTITSIAIGLGSGSITATGTGSYASLFGTIPISFSYVFTIDTDNEPADFGWPNGIPPTVLVRTISLTVTGAAGGPLGWLVNILLASLFPFVEKSLQSGIESTVQGAIDRAVANALASKNAPPGTIATAEIVSITPDAVSITPWAGVDLDKACASTPSSGSIRIRPKEQLQHLRLIRDRLLTVSPQGRAYLELAERFNGEIVRMFLEDEQLLRKVDDVVDEVLKLFPGKEPHVGKLSRRVADQVVDVMDFMSRSCSAELGLTIKALREEVHSFVDRPAGEVLQESFGVIEGELGEPS